MEKSLSIIIPVYNEEKALPLVLPELLSFVKAHGYQLILVNDGSTDSTLDTLNSYVSGHTECRIIHHKVNRGYGGAIKSGISAARTDFLVTIDADGQHVLEDINRLFDQLKLKDADMVIGSRRGNKDASVIRGVGKKIIRWLAKRMMPMPIYDLNSGLKLYNTKLAQKYITLCPNSMAFSDIIGLVFISQRHLVLEHPISIKARVEGESTIGVKTAFDTVLEILNMVILFNPMRIFLPLSLVFVVTGLIWAIQFLVVGKGLSNGAAFLISVGVIFFTIGLISEQLSQLRKSGIINKEKKY